MAIDSASSAIGLLVVNPGHDDKAHEDAYHRDGRRRQHQEESSSLHPVLNEQGQIMGLVIDIKV